MLSDSKCKENVKNLCILYVVIMFAIKLDNQIISNNCPDIQDPLFVMTREDECVYCVCSLNSINSLVKIITTVPHCKVSQM